MNKLFEEVSWDDSGVPEKYRRGEAAPRKTGMFQDQDVLAEEGDFQLINVGGNYGLRVIGPDGSISVEIAPHRKYIQLGSTVKSSDDIVAIANLVKSAERWYNDAGRVEPIKTPSIRKV